MSARHSVSCWLRGGLRGVRDRSAAEAQYRALHPPLRQLLEDQFGGFAIDTVGIDRHDTPVEIEGRLIADATITDAGANLRVRVAARLASTRARSLPMAACRSPSPAD